MTGIIVTWDESEMQAIDEGNFESTVVDVVDSFFEAANGYSEVTVEWRTVKEEDPGSQYKVSEPPLTHLDRSRCFINIVGESRGGEYQIDMSPSGFYIKTLSSGHTRELEFLRLRDEGLAINNKEKEVFLSDIPDRIKKRIVDVIQ